jgi:hypothetical protein
LQIFKFEPVKCWVFTDGPLRPLYIFQSLNFKERRMKERNKETKKQRKKERNKETNKQRNKQTNKQREK